MYGLYAFIENRFMNYIQLHCIIADAGTKDIIIALLEQEGFEGFEETEAGLLAYIPEPEFKKDGIDELFGPFGVSYTIQTIAPKNWNEEWEKNFEPVVVEGFCTVRADFHEKNVDTPYDIIITPKMSFGTGHHATTRLMMQQMKGIDFKGKSVFDFGTGTGILAILGEMLGANDVIAIDNDEWAYENSKENLQRNNTTYVKVSQGSITDIVARQFDIILANINRHILLEYMSNMYNLLKPGGTILMSGLLKEDVEIVKPAAIESGFTPIQTDELNNWVVLKFVK